MLQLWKTKLLAFGAVLKSAILSNSSYKIILLVTSGVLGVYMIDRILTHPEPTHYQEQMKAWKARAEITEIWNDSLKVKNIALEKFVDSVDVQVKLRDMKITTLNDKVSAMRKKNDGILAALTISLPDTCKAALVLAESYKSESDSNKKIFLLEKLNVDVLTLSKDSLKTQNIRLLSHSDSLVKLLKSVPEYKEEKFLHIIPMPTRTTAFVTGGVLGVVVTIVSLVALHK